MERWSTEEPETRQSILTYLGLTFNTEGTAHHTASTLPEDEKPHSFKLIIGKSQNTKGIDNDSSLVRTGTSEQMVDETEILGVAK